MILFENDSVVLISSYEIDELHGSEPSTGFNLTELSALKFKKTILVTSNLTKQIVLDSLKERFKEKIEIHVVRVQSLYWSSHPIGFYPVYRRWQKDFGKFLNKNKVEFDLGIHASLGTFLFGSGFSLYDKPYVFGPAGFSFFRMSYARAYGWKSLIEVSRNLVVFALLIGDPFVRLSLLRAHTVIAGDRMVTKILQKIYPESNLLEKTIPHYHGSPYKYEASDSDKLKLDLIWTGRFISRKDPLFALEVFCEILTHSPDAKLTMIGDGKLRKKIEKFLQKNNLKKSVTITGWVEKSEVLSMMKQANLMLFTSFRETAGVQLFECNSVGTRVIALNATGAASWYRNQLIEFVPVSFLESRTSLIRKYSLRSIKMRNEALFQDIPLKNREVEINLLEEILSSICKS